MLYTNINNAFDINIYIENKNEIKTTRNVMLNSNG